jgi:HPt (histidine-containing phosphotransfer) domain-containing protein
MPISAHALNHEIIDDLYAILGDGYTEIVDEQVEQALKYLKELGELLQADNAKMVTRTAHALKSSAGQVGLEGIHALAKNLEIVSTADQEQGVCSDEAKMLHRTICTEFKAAVMALRDYVKNK